ncbi:hypothetical protein [Actinomadura litoris]|uniref:hypothetical protein n=1 Tax=Actinomadura litoris TaxID=2678616 RepID=UPI001FA70A14|nr:hypothetical protein [Actinomadura litoris]
MLADTGMVGDARLWVFGPIIVFAALAVWLTLTLTASRERKRPRGKDPGLPHRGAVTGGIIEGSPAQRTRRDAAPTEAEREAAAARAEALAAEREQARREAELERQRASSRRKRRRHPLLRRR